jgi:hypothetical protein
MLTAYYTLKPLYGRIAVDDPSLIFVSRGDRLLPAKLVFSNQHEAFRKANIRQGACIFVSFAHRSSRFKTRNEPRLVTRAVRQLGRRSIRGHDTAVYGERRGL